MSAVTIPIFPSPDFDETEGFYTQLGFHEVARFGGEYLIIQHPANIELHFFHDAHVDLAKNDHGAYVRFGSDFEAESLYNQWWAAGPEGGDLRAPATTDYGLLEFALLDPHRNLLRVGGFINPSG
ncbi:MAG: hypothetical protein OEM97_06490 [Acidimicrobiia bacterium]|nr:hypothetical protein [Acidimicrobiia bacterium]